MMDEFSSGGIPPEDAAGDLLSSAAPKAAPSSGSRSSEFQQGTSSGSPGMATDLMGGGSEGGVAGAGAEGGALAGIEEALPLLAL